MKTSVFFIGIIFSAVISLQGIAQQTELSSQEILEKTIKYHDPDNVWETYKGKLYEVTVLYPWNYVVKETIEIDNQNDFYLSTCFQEFGTLKRGIDKGKNIFSLNDKPEIPDEIKDNWGISNEGIKRYSAQHHGHFGLPMVLKNSGMELQKNVKNVIFEGRKCYALRFIGKPELVKNPFFEGEVILNVDCNNYAMRGLNYSAGDISGYTIFSGEIEINGLKVVHAKIAYNKDDTHASTSVNFLVQE